MGGGRGYGPTHSQTLDRHFLGVPGLRVVAMNGFVAPGLIYNPLMATDSGPTLMIENKLLYGSYLPLDVCEGYELLHSSEVFPSTWIRPQAEQCDVTLLGYGGIADLLVQAADALFDEHDIVAQIVIPSQIYPFSIVPLADVIGRAGRLMIVEEGQGFAGFGAEIIAQIGDTEAISAIRTRRLFPPAHCIPSSGPLEKDVLPSVDKIVSAVAQWIAS
jgi:2-oxoisovalerate dehydrogenase E1 component